MDDARVRFGKLWAQWDERIAAGDPPPKILREFKDEDLVEILGGESTFDRRYDRDIIATELLNRLHARSSKHPAGARAVARSTKTALDTARQSQAAIHKAEGILKRSGQWDLGAAVSASAYASLDATAGAFEAAKEQAGSLHESLAQSRKGTELAEEATRTAEEGIEVTEALEAHMKHIGKGKEGRAAAEASRDIHDATERAAQRAAAHDANVKRSGVQSER